MVSSTSASHSKCESHWCNGSMTNSNLVGLGSIPRWLVTRDSDNSNTLVIGTRDRGSSPLPATNYGGCRLKTQYAIQTTF